MFMVCAISEVHVGIPGPPVAGGHLLSMVHVATEGYGDVRGLCCHLKPC